MKIRMNYTIAIFMAVSIFICVAACEEDEKAATPSPGEIAPNKWNEFGPYVVLSLVGESYFLGIMDSLSIGTYTQANSIEVAGMYYSVYQNRIYMMPHYAGGGTDIKVLSVGPDNSLTVSGSIPVPAGSSPGGVFFVNAQTAFIPLTSDGKIMRINPKTLATTAEIDLRQYAVGSTSAADDDNSPEPTSIVMRDGKLYVALQQSYNNMQMGRPIMQVAVINIETNSVEKIISDDTSGLSMAGSIVNKGGYMFVDENGDIYIHGAGSWGWVEGQNAGFLRINAGESEFDTTWTLNFSDFSPAVNGGVIDYLHYATYAGNGIVYGSAHVPADESDPVDWVNDRCYTHVKVDVWNNTIEALPLPPTSPYASDAMMEGDYLITPLYTDVGAGIYVYNPNTNQVVGNSIVQSEGIIGAIRLLK